MLKRLISCALLLINISAFAQTAEMQDYEDDDLNVGGDIFNDFNEDIESSQILEDERFYRYGRFYSFSFSLGMTTFGGNRGLAYEDQPPSYGLSLNYFFDFETSFVMGLEFSNHHFYIDQPVYGYNPDPPGLISVNMLRGFFAYRYYVDTSNLGTAITWANPYFTARLEYWYVTNKFVDQNLDDDGFGGLGVGLGGGFEFPIKIKESYVGVEMLVHSVAFRDKFTQEYAPLPVGDANYADGFGYPDMTGYAFSTMVSYVMSW